MNLINKPGMSRWYKIGVWAAVLLVLYVLRSFFLIIFLTFVISYIMRGLVDRSLRVVSPKVERRWLDRAFVMAFFILLLTGLYFSGRVLIPQLVRQGEALITKLSSIERSPKAQLDEFLRDTVGAYLLRQEVARDGSNGVLSEPLDAGHTEERKQELLERWKEQEIARKLADTLEESLVGGMAAIGKFLGSKVPALLGLPVQLALIMLLSFFICFDFGRMRRGVARLETSQAREIYAELAPSFVSFGMLMGRAFQAQAVIAIVNTILTYLALWFLKVENEIFLSAIVFVCSFIPVLGSFLSSIPIAIMAFVQEGGGISLAVWVIVAILIVHFIETSILNPKIIGEMLHLHPVMVLGVLAIGEHFAGAWRVLLAVPVAVYIIRVVILGEDIIQIFGRRITA